jgi:cobalamin biosynthesis protein CbiG
VLVVGVGARRGVPGDELDALIDAALAGAGLAATDVRALATVNRRADEPGIVAVAARRGWPLLDFGAEELAAESVPHPSERVLALAGTPSVCEAAALRGARDAGGVAELVVAKLAGGSSTVAIAQIGHSCTGTLSCMGGR